MAAVRTSAMSLPKGLPSPSHHLGGISIAAKTTLTNAPKMQMASSSIPLPKFTTTRGPLYFTKIADIAPAEENGSVSGWNGENLKRVGSKSSDPLTVAKLHAVMEAVVDRVEMHRNIGEQRNGWNHLLLNSINTMTLVAATMAGVAATAANGAAVPALKLASVTLYAVTTGISLVMNKIQPSQLAEEQRNAARLFRQLQCHIRTKLSIGEVNASDVNEAVERVSALDKAYPLPLLGTMLEKFPATVKPAVWWPEKQRRKRVANEKVAGNGWSRELEEEMKAISGVLERKDLAEYLKLGKKVLKLHKILSVSGPLLTGLGALGSAFVGNPQNTGATIVAILCGALATIVNVLEHGGQVGMVFEMYRSNAGFFELIKQTVEENIRKGDVERRENGEILELKVALQLGRSISELRNLAAAARAGESEQRTEEFASKLF